MFRSIYFLLIVQLMFCPVISAQPGTGPNIWELQQIECKASLRGLCVVDSMVIWASGSGGTVLRTVDSGKNWKVFQVADAEELDFRDIQAFDANMAVIVSAGTPARVYRTVDGGETWEIVFEHEDEKAFFDAMEFNGDFGVIFSDPLDGRLEMITSNDLGQTWTQLDKSARPIVLEGEAGFAASGSCLQIHNGKIWIGLGGKHEKGFARIISCDPDFKEEWTEHDTLIQANESSGIFSLAFANADHGVAVGGNYSEADDTDSNIAITDDGGKNWRKISGNPPSGYRSAVAFVEVAAGKTVGLSVGPNGTDITLDLGNSWKQVSKEGFHSIAFSRDGSTGWATGGDGRVARLDLAKFDLAKFDQDKLDQDKIESSKSPDPNEQQDSVQQFSRFLKLQLAREDEVRKQREGLEDALDLAIELESARESGLRIAIALIESSADGKFDEFPGLAGWFEYISEQGRLPDPSLDVDRWPELDIDAMTKNNPLFWQAYYETAPGNGVIEAIYSNLLKANGEILRSQQIACISRLGEFAPEGFHEVMLSSIHESQRVIDAANVQIDKGIKSFDAGEYDQAETAFQSVVDEWPSNGLATYELGLTTFFKDEIKAGRKPPEFGSTRSRDDPGIPSAEVYQLFDVARQHDPMIRGAYQQDTNQLLMVARVVIPAYQHVSNLSAKEFDDNAIKALALGSQKIGLHDYALIAQQTVISRRGKYEPDDLPLIIASLEKLIGKEDTTKIQDKLAQKEIKLFLFGRDTKPDQN